MTRVSSHSASCAPSVMTSWSGGGQAQVLGQVPRDLGAQRGQPGWVEAVAVERAPGGVRVDRRQVTEVAGADTDRSMVSRSAAMRRRSVVVTLVAVAVHTGGPAT